MKSRNLLLITLVIAIVVLFYIAYRDSDPTMLLFAIIPMLILHHEFLK